MAKLAVVSFTLFLLYSAKPTDETSCTPERRCLCDGARVSCKKVCFALGVGRQEMRLKRSVIECHAAYGRRWTPGPPPGPVLLESRPRDHVFFRYASRFNKAMFYYVTGSVVWRRLLGPRSPMVSGAPGHWWSDPTTHSREGRRREPVKKTSVSAQRVERFWV